MASHLTENSNSLMKICQVGLNLLPQNGGTPRAVFDIHEGLGGTVLSFTNPWLLGSTTHRGVTHIPCDKSWVGRRYGYAAPATSTVFEHFVADADIVVIHGLFRFHFDWAVATCKALKRPYVVVPHGSLNPGALGYRTAQKVAWLAMRGRRAIERAALVLFATATERELARAVVKLQRTADIAFHVTTPPPSTSEHRLDVRRARGYAPDDFVLLFLGRLSSEKRPLDIIRAFAQAQARAPNLRLLVVGPDGDISLSDCAAFASSIGVKHVQFEGGMYGPDKSAVLACADLMINFSTTENFGYVACEGLSHGIPAILSSGNSIGPILSPVGCAWHMQRDSVPALSEAMVRAAHTPSDTLSAMGARGRDWVRRELDPKVFAARLRNELVAAAG